MKGCRNCRHWQTQEIYLDRLDAATTNQKVQLGLCRRHAPRPGTASGERAADIPGPGICPWPRVASDDWCGEWEPAFS